MTGVSLEAGSGDLQVDGLCKRFGTVVALDGLSLRVRAGEIFGFVGSNGSGKTTTMRIILGVTEPDDGQVRWRGTPITEASRRRIGYMPEERGLYPRMKVGEQLRYLARLHGMGARAAEHATRVWTDRLGVAGRLNDEVQKLSLGNQQRVQLAAALIHEPEVLVLDEPFSGLDPLAVDVMSGVLREKADAGVPVVFSSHQLDLVERVCDVVGIIQAGRMVTQGKVDALRSQGPRRQVVDVPGSDGAWARDLPGVTVVAVDGGRAILQLQDQVDDQAVLRAALAEGPVTEFSPVRPALVDLYRHVVDAPPAGTDTGAGTRADTADATTVRS
jgi:ABC-2 type transport system ATP-binding protein